ncbi:MAG: ABC transporter permease [Planctomycetota bacterium]|jgi:putative ABC transport system permease protein
MKAIDVKNQPRVGFARLMSLTVNGIRYRLFRSSVTVVVIAVAIAFLMNVLSEGLLKGSIRRMTSRRIAEERRAAVWAARLSVPGTIEEIIEEVAAAEEGGPVWEEARRMGYLSLEDMTAYHKSAKRAAVYLGFFRKLDYARRRVLVRQADGIEIFTRLREPAELENTKRELKNMKSVRFVSTYDELDAFLEEWPSLLGYATAVLKGREEAIATIRQGLAGKSVIAGLADAEGAFGDAIREAKFSFDPAHAKQIAGQARQLLDVRFVEDSTADPEIRRKVSAYLDVMPAQVNALVLWDLLSDRTAAAWFLERLKDNEIDSGSLDVDRITSLAAAKADESALAGADRIVAGSGGGFVGIGERMTWLTIVAMLVCVVGVANAMLMSVTERFREIATLKCLGALDGSIMGLFVLEASLLGVVGGVAGALVGTLIGLGRMLMLFGGLIVPAFPAGDLALAVTVSTTMGVILAAVAAVYPSFRAARLAPMEAMRIQ